MSKKEAVFLVSRAMAILWGFNGLIDALYLPERFLATAHYLYVQSVMDTSILDTSTYYVLDYGILSPILWAIRTGLYLLAAVLFWRCGPTVARLFEPPSN